MATQLKLNRKSIDIVMVSLGIVATVVLVIIGGLAWWASSFTSSTVRSELVSQRIYFPPQGSVSLSPAEFPDLQRYAGQLVDNGPKAKAFANGFIARHLAKVANGQTYAQVSAKAVADPTNTMLQKQAQTLFQGETLRGLLLGDAYAFWTVGRIAEIAAIVSFVAAAVMAILVILGFAHIAQS